MVERPFSKRSVWPERRQGRLRSAHPTFLYTPPNGRIGSGWLGCWSSLALLGSPNRYRKYRALGRICIATDRPLVGLIRQMAAVCAISHHVGLVDTQGQIWANLVQSADLQR